MTVIKVGLTVVFLLCAVFATNGSTDDYGFKHCEEKVKQWASSAMESEPKGDKHALRDLLFFLHVPRTGGRTYFYCFLKKLYSNSQECPRSYDKLRFNPRKTNCRLVSTHDDYSIMSKLPKEETSVVTILRNPIERVFSAYEFSVEVAARFLVHPNLTTVDELTRIARERQNVTTVSTLVIWPWKYLVPWMREDLFARRDARKLRGQVHIVNDNAYDMEDILMPLHEYINAPTVTDIVHNGATFQITGLTNNSFSDEAHEVRHCVMKYKSLGEYVLEVAKKRLDDMLYIGFTEKHKESASMFANFVGSQVISQHRKTTSELNVASTNALEQSTMNPNTKSNADSNGNGTDQNVETPRGNLTVAKLMKLYESCVTNLRRLQGERRRHSLKHISPANFTKESRQKVPEDIMQEIASLNSLDMELYHYAQNIFAAQQAHVLNKDRMISNTKTVVTTFSENTAEEEEDFYSVTSWKLLSLVFISSVLLLLFVYLLVNARRRLSKVKL